MANNGRLVFEIVINVMEIVLFLSQNIQLNWTI